MLTTDLPAGIDLAVYPNIVRSFNDIASANIYTDVSKVVAGFSIVFVYVVVMLGEFDRVENRVRQLEKQSTAGDQGGERKKES